MTKPPDVPGTRPNTAVPPGLVARALAVLAFERALAHRRSRRCAASPLSLPRHGLACGWCCRPGRTSSVWLLSAPRSLAALATAHPGPLAGSREALARASTAIRACRTGPSRPPKIAREWRRRPVDPRDVGPSPEAAAGRPRAALAWRPRRPAWSSGTGSRCVPPCSLAPVAAAFVAGPEKYGRVAAAFSFTQSGSRAGHPHRCLDRPARLHRQAAARPGRAETGRPISTPRRSSAPRPGPTSSSASQARDASTSRARARSGPLPLTQWPACRRAGHARQALHVGGRRRTPDRAGGRQGRRVQAQGHPRHAAPHPPRRVRRRSMRAARFALAYTIEDDYGVTGAEAHFANPVVRGRAVTGRALVEPPRGTLALPAMPGGLGDGKTTLDLSDHPWAGAQVSMTLSARDEGGNVGESAPTTMMLPAKPFSNPLARALVEQRRNLVLDPDDRADGGDGARRPADRSRVLRASRSVSISACIRPSCGCRPPRPTPTCSASRISSGRWRCASRTAT